MKIFYAVVSMETFVVLNVIEWDNTKPNRPESNAGTLVQCSSTVAIGDELDTATGVFTHPRPVTTGDVNAGIALASASISEVAAELAQVEKSVQVLMTQK
ncbi:hypothetical protein [Paraburkholderia sediminicola]|uniref:hypothetical protein n=1 Tax=Paraburkholderia sediminicola TaxID=458836 RepID=UPI0038B98F3C